MYKVVIVDDEFFIVEGLQRAFDWSAFQCQVVATGFDAISGAEAVRTHHPDILFTDIQMPNEDGLTMLAGLKSEFPQMKIAVLTGFRDFEYAQRAIKLGVSRFLLKPSKMDELEEAVSHMVSQLQEQPEAVPEPAPVITPDEVPPSGMVAGSFIVQQALGYLEEAFPEKLTLQMVADHCYVSQWHLSKLLNRHTNQSFYDLLNAVRIRHAKELLCDPSLRVADIGERVGYQDTAHFSRTFKKLEGLSANEYRNSLAH